MPDNAAFAYLKGMNYIFIINILMKFTIAYYKEGLLIKNKENIVKNYILGHFVIDLISISFLLFSNTNTLQKLVFFLKVPEIYKLQYKYQEYLFFNEKKQKILKILLIVLNILLISHCFACFWYIIGNSSQYDQNWVKKADLNSLEQSEAYFICFYWVFSVLISKPDFNRFGPTNKKEYIFCVLMEIIGVFMLIYVFWAFKLMKKTVKNEKTNALKNIGSFKGLSATKNNRIIKSTFELDEKVIKKENLTFFKGDLIIEEFKGLMNRIPFFRDNFRESFIDKLSKTVEIMQFLPNQPIFQVFIIKKNIYLFIIVPK